MARNTKLQLDDAGYEQWMTTDGRFGVVKQKRPINPMEVTEKWKYRTEYSIHNLEGYEGPMDFIELAPEVGRVETFDQVFPWLGEYTKEGSFELGNPKRVTPKVEAVLDFLGDVLGEGMGPVPSHGDVSKKWIAGVKRWWKQWVNKAKVVSQRAAKAKPEVARKMMLDYLDEGRARLERLRESLMFTKGMNVEFDFTGDRKKDAKWSSDAPGRMLVYEFTDAFDRLSTLRSNVEHVWEGVHGSGKDKPIVDYLRQKRYGEHHNLDGWDAEVEQLPSKEKVGEVDALVSRKIFARLNRFATMMAKEGMRPNMGRFAGSESGIEKEFSVGRMKFVYSPGRVSPTTIAKSGDRESLHHGKYRSPRYAPKFVRYAKQAKALIQKAGFGRAWYGVVSIVPSGWASNFRGETSGKKYREGGHYTASSDGIVSFVEPGDYFVELLIHEIGHRWYYKFMNQEQRLAFSSYFGKGVKAVSSYGAENAREDFAEVFTWYVLEKKLNRDQRERFKEFATKRQRAYRHEEIEKIRDALLG